jgi:hypothetical protein
VRTTAATYLVVRSRRRDEPVEIVGGLPKTLPVLHVAPTSDYPRCCGRSQKCSTPCPTIR